MCHIPIKMLKKDAIPKSDLQSLKIYSSKACRKLVSQKCIICVANAAILKLRIFSGRYHFRHNASGCGFLLRLVNTFTIDTEEYSITEGVTR